MHRAELIKELSNVIDESSVDAAANFVLEDRRRICQPLIKIKQLSKDRFVYLSEKDIAINETLRLAGLNE